MFKVIVLNWSVGMILYTVCVVCEFEVLGQFVDMDKLHGAAIMGFILLNFCLAYLCFELAEWLIKHSKI